MTDGKFSPQALLNSCASLWIQDQYKQRYFNPSRALMMVTKFADAQRNLDMDNDTWKQFANSPLNNIANVVQPNGSTATVSQQPQAEQVDIEAIMTKVIKQTIKPEALL
tara:strand:+ start:104 stop:430 length:327 start_codon:yes stop_codon:yes gene_type:complete